MRDYDGLLRYYAKDQLRKEVAGVAIHSGMPDDTQTLHMTRPEERYAFPLLPVGVRRVTLSSANWGRWHYHHQIEMLYIVNGSMDVQIDRQTYFLRKGDVVIVGSNQPHRELANNTECIHLQFEGSGYFDIGILSYWALFARTGYSLSKINYIFSNNRRAKRIAVRCIQGIFQEMNKRETGYEAAVGMLIHKLLLTLLREDTLGVLPRIDHLGMMRLQPVLDYIQRNITGKIKVEEVRKVAGFSYAHFLKYFKEIVGMTFVDYVNAQRIKEAERLLLTEPVSVEQAAERVGFYNTGHFYKVFRKINRCSPREFCKKLSGSPFHGYENIENK